MQNPDKKFRQFDLRSVNISDVFTNCQPPWKNRSLNNTAAV